MNLTSNFEVEAETFNFFPFENDSQILRYNCCLSFNFDEKLNLRIEIQENNQKIVNFHSIKLLGSSGKTATFKTQDGIINIRMKIADDISNLTKWLEKNDVKTEKFIEKEITEDLIEESFKIEMKKHAKLGFNSKQYLAKKLKNLINKFDSKYYGPFTTLCQSSGFGKTRACEELVDENFYVVYCCLRNKISTGFPPRSCLANFLQSNHDEKTQKINFKSYLNMFIDILNNQKIGCKEFFEEYSYNHKDKLLKLMEIKIKTTNEDSLLSVYVGSNPLIFIFDESSTLLETRSPHESSYFLFRRVLSKLEGNVFVLFLDTFTNFSEYHPPKLADPSGRVNTSQKILFEPIYLLPNWDLFADYTSIKNISDSVKFENICRFGRVLWGSWMYTKQNSDGKFKNVTDDNIYELAISKLTGGRVWNKFNLTDSECLAISSSRVGTIKPGRILASQDLVAKNMAICTNVSINNDVFEIGYASEPILAIAAAFLMHNYGIDKVIDSLIKNVESSLISQGNRGETIAKFILIDTIDKITSSKLSKKEYKYLKLTTVGEFIQGLYGKCKSNCGNIQNGWKCLNNENDQKFICPIKIINEQLKDYTELLNGYINFNHFIKLNFSLKEASLEKCLKRCAAIHCKHEQTGIDLVIPVCLSNENFDSITAILFQVKLHSDPKEIGYIEAFDNITSKLFYDFDPNKSYLLIFMQLGEHSNRASFIKNIKPESQRGTENSKRAIIYSEGLSEKVFPNLNSIFIQKLQNFSRSKSFYKDQSDFEIYETVFDSIRK